MVICCHGEVIEERVFPVQNACLQQGTRTWPDMSLSGPTPLTLYTTYISGALSGPTPLRYILLTLESL